MIITIVDGVVIWKFYRKAYHKARWRKVGERQINDMLKYYPNYNGIIIIKCSKKRKRSAKFYKSASR